MAKQVRSIIKEISKDLDNLFNSDENIKGIWCKYVKYGDLSDISYVKEKNKYIISFFFEGKAYGDGHSDLYPKSFKRLTDNEYEGLKPKWVYSIFSERYDINVSKNYVIEAIVRKIERKSGKKINDVYYQCSYD